MKIRMKTGMKTSVSLIWDLRGALLGTNSKASCACVWVSVQDWKKNSMRKVKKMYEKKCRKDEIRMKPG